MLDKRAQITVLIALSFSFLFIIFAMVTNISFLVSTKINLQNAVDMASYAGAAQQARFLNEIGKWNYEMRRIYKAMVYDYQITLNAEINPQYFKFFVLNKKSPSGKYLNPIACCSLERSYSLSDPRERRKLCQFDNVSDAFAQSEAARKVAELAQSALRNALLSGDNGLIASALLNQQNATKVQTQAATLQQNHQDLMRNYQVFNSSAPDNIYKGSVFPVYNYNYRLLAWMLHAYRHLETRIRGVHAGNLDIGPKKYDPSKGTTKDIPNRLSILKDNTVSIFDNAPISIAAKVINSYYKEDSDNISGVKDYLDLMDKDKKYAQSNPIHNATVVSFEKNLLNVLRDNPHNIYAIIPNIEKASNMNFMAQGCGGKCDEFTGPYLRLFAHDLAFNMFYMSVVRNIHTYKKQTESMFTNNFPVGVIKDASVLTYYTVVGVASTKDIPFNVFFGNGIKSKRPPLVAVASARPFGSRIGPYIYADDTACSLNDTTTAKCREQGFDPLYPSPNNFMPDFSVLEPRGTTLSTKYITGVRYTVEKTEYDVTKIPTDPSGVPLTRSNLNSFVKLMSKTEDKNARWRYYRNPDNITKDDGFQSSYMDDEFYEHKLIMPQGCKNSIFAWQDKPTNNAKLIPPSSINLLNSFEWYLDKLHGKAVFKMPIARQKSSTSTGGSGVYHIYLFKYPQYRNNLWDIENLTGKTGTKWTNQMESAFANAMAVSEFELRRYILPFTKTSIATTNNVLNWFYEINKDGYVFLGAKNRENPTIGEGNKKILGEIITKQETGINELNSNVNDFPEMQTAWLKGLRGYRVKFVPTRLLTLGKLNNGKTQNNPLPKNITLQFKGVRKPIHIDLSEIPY